MSLPILKPIYVNDPALITALQLVASCVADEKGGVTLGSYEQSVVRDALARVSNELQANKLREMGFPDTAQLIQGATVEHIPGNGLFKGGN